MDALGGAMVGRVGRGARRGRERERTGLNHSLFNGNHNSLCSWNVPHYQAGPTVAHLRLMRFSRGLTAPTKHFSTLHHFLFNSFVYSAPSTRRRRGPDFKTLARGGRSPGLLRQRARLYLTSAAVLFRNVRRIQRSVTRQGADQPVMLMR